MKEKQTFKKEYEKPTIEVIAFSFKDSIAASMQGAGLFEQIWGGGDSA